MNAAGSTSGRTLALDPPEESSMRRSAFFAIFVILLLITNGCGVQDPRFRNITSVIVDSSSNVVGPGNSVVLTASVPYDFADRGVTWQMACAKCGTLSAATPTTVTYTAPPDATVALAPIVQATSNTLPLATGSKTLSVSDSLAITTTELPLGQTGVGYGTVLATAGGVEPMVWSLASGTLPPGLTLDGKSGSINGVPSVRGVSSFTLKVTDGIGTVASGVFFITVALDTVSSPPISITTTSLPDAAIHADYAFQVQATGGTPPYFWFLNTPLPLGMTLSPAGVIAGRPYVHGAFSVDFAVADSAVPAKTANATLVLTVANSTNNDFLLDGRYAFLFSGYVDDPNTKLGNAITIAGSFAADGGGLITGGVEDINSSGQTVEGVSFTGQYTLSTANRGIMTIRTSLGTTARFAIEAGASDNAGAHTVRFIEFDDLDGQTGTRGSGTMRLQDPSSFSLSAITGKYVFGIAGETAAKDVHSGAGIGGPVAAVGLFVADGNGNLGQGTLDATVGISSVPTVALSGNYSAPDATTGRSTFMIPEEGGSNLPSHYAVYMVSEAEMFIVSLDAHASASMVSGTIEAQGPEPFRNASLDGRFVVYENGQALTNQGLPDPNRSDAAMALYDADSQGNCNLIERDENAGGVVTQFTMSNVAKVVPCVVQASGRGTFGTDIFYLTGPGSGFYINRNIGTLGYLEAQTPPKSPSVGYTAADILGFDVEGSLAPSTTKMTLSSGTFNASIGSLVFEWADVSTAQGSLQSATGVQKSYVTETTGRTTLPDFLGGVDVVYAISPTKLIMMDAFGTVTAPSMQVIER